MGCFIRYGLKSDSADNDHLAFKSLFQKDAFTRSVGVRGVASDHPAVIFIARPVDNHFDVIDALAFKAKQGQITRQRHPTVYGSVVAPDDDAGGE